MGTNSSQHCKNTKKNVPVYVLVVYWLLGNVLGNSCWSIVLCFQFFNVPSLSNCGIVFHLLL